MLIPRGGDVGGGGADAGGLGVGDLGGVAGAVVEFPVLPLKGLESRRADPMAPTTSSPRSIGAAIIELYPNRSANRALEGGTAGLRSKGAN